MRAAMAVTLGVTLAKTATAFFAGSMLSSQWDESRKWQVRALGAERQLDLLKRQANEAERRQARTLARLNAAA
jgi:hypothetical protein